MTTQQQLVDRLRPLGVRLTPQRLAIAEVVVNSADHPSVRDIYERVRAFFPYVTIATVYSTLDMLEELENYHFSGSRDMMPICLLT